MAIKDRLTSMDIRRSRDKIDVSGRLVYITSTPASSELVTSVLCYITDTHVTPMTVISYTRSGTLAQLQKGRTLDYENPRSNPSLRCEPWASSFSLQCSSPLSCVPVQSRSKSITCFKEDWILRYVKTNNYTL